jgi:hypothetical protein
MCGLITLFFDSQQNELKNLNILILIKMMFRSAYRMVMKYIEADQKFNHSGLIWDAYKQENRILTLLPDILKNNSTLILGDILMSNFISTFDYDMRITIINEIKLAYEKGNRNRYLLILFQCIRDNNKLMDLNFDRKNEPELKNWLASRTFNMHTDNITHEWKDHKNGRIEFVEK